MKHFKLMKGVLACLLSLALVFSCFSSVGLKAEEAAAGTDTSTTVTAPTAVNDATFKWATESIEHSTAAYVYVLKAKSGNTIKKGSKSVQLAKADGATVFSATMTDLGVKVGKKDVYLYICDKEFEDDGKNISANLEIKAPAAKKITATIDYAKADGTELNVISAKAVDTSKKEIKNPEIWWSTEADGTYFQVNDATLSTSRKYAGAKDGDPFAPNGFNGKTLNDYLAAGGGIIYIKMAGVDGASGTAQFGSKAVKVKIAKQAAAPKIKIDAKKDTLAIKNGFDFGYAKKESDGSYTVLKWFTVLPNLKTAAVKTSAASIVATTSYTPLAKKDSNAGKEVTSTSGSDTIKTYSYTAYKFKAVSINAILAKFEENATELEYAGGDCVIAVRKSATEKKPASAAAYFELSGQSLSPIVYTQDNVAGQYLVATATEFEKKGFSIGTIVPYPGSVSGQPTQIATKGYDDTFEVGKTSHSGDKIVDADANGSSFEFAIVASKDLNAAEEKAIDWSTIKWKKIDSKTKITSKLKTKYNLLDGTKVTAQLGTESAQATASGSGEAAWARYSTVKNFIVIRRAGDSKSAVRASEVILLYVAKEGKNYNLYSTVDNGDVAYKYNVKFLKYQKGSDDTYGWALASDVEDISVWLAPEGTKYVTLPTVDPKVGDMKKATSANSGYTVVSSASGAVTLETDATNKGKYAITTPEGTSGETTEYIAIREYANITVKQVVSVSGATTPLATTVYYQQKDGKYKYANGTSGEATYFADGGNFSISGIAVPSISGYSISFNESANSGVATTLGSGATTASKVINSSDEVVIEIKYTAVAKREITLSNSIATDAAVVTVKKSGETTNLLFTENKESDILDGTVLVVTVDPAEGKEFSEVKINDQVVSFTENKYTANITVSKDTTTIKVEGTLK